MDNFIYSVPNYTIDWSKYIHSIPDPINPKTELFNFLNITEPSFNTLHLNPSPLPSSKFAKTVRSRNSG